MEGCPTLSVVIPTFNNRVVLQRTLEGWQRFAPPGNVVEIIVVQDGDGDDTSDYLRAFAARGWGRDHLRWVKESDAHELCCTNRGFREARGRLVAAWQDDMIPQSHWFATEIIRNFDAYPDLGLLGLTRGLNCFPCDDPIESWEDLQDPKRMQSDIGPPILNWLRLQEIDVVIRPWVVRRVCLEKVGLLDEAFRPTEWDEADLCYRIRQAAEIWRTAAHCYERAGAYLHLGSSTLNFSDRYKRRVLSNGRLFHQRWDETIRDQHPRERRAWQRRLSLKGALFTAHVLVVNGVRRMYQRFFAATSVKPPLFRTP